MDSLAAQIMVNIINREMAMPLNSVWLRDEARQIPDDLGLYIVVGLVNSIPVSNIVYMQGRAATNSAGDAITRQFQISEAQMQENIQIDVLSRSNDARLRNVEVLMALQSFYSQQQQELNNFKIFRNARNFVNTSSAEGGSFLNRYSLTIAAMVWYRKEKLLNSPLGDYYDDFRTRADDAQTIGTSKPIAEFEITPDTPEPL